MRNILLIGLSCIALTGIGYEATKSPVSPIPQRLANTYSQPVAVASSVPAMDVSFFDGTWSKTRDTISTNIANIAIVSDPKSYSIDDGFISPLSDYTFTHSRAGIDAVPVVFKKDVPYMQLQQIDFSQHTLEGVMSCHEVKKVGTTYQVKIYKDWGAVSGSFEENRISLEFSKGQYCVGSGTIVFERN